MSRSEAIGRLSLTGRVAVVTGAAGGIGRATVDLLAARGAIVVATDILEPGAFDPGSAREYRFSDIADEVSVARLIDGVAARHGRIDILVNGAADQSAEQLAADGDIESVTVAAWDRAFHVNLRGQMLTCRAAIPHMLAGGGGAIVNLGSNRGLQGGLRGIAYSTTKAAILQLTRNIATSHGKRGIRANAVSPGLTLTPGVVEKVPEAFRAIVAEEAMVPALGGPDEIAEVIAFLASDAAAYINGENIVVDGGLAMHTPGLAAMQGLGRREATGEERK